MIEVSTTFEKPVHLVLNLIPPRVRETEVSKFARMLSSHFSVDMAGWLPFSEEIIGSLSRSILTLKTPKDPIAARFRALAERVEAFA
jgi:hypothetical protein